MAFNDEQKKRIKELALQLEAGGMPRGQAAQTAVSQLFTPKDLEQIFAPDVAPPSAAPIVDERSADIQGADIELRDLETKFIRERTRQIEAQGTPTAEAEKQARAEIEAYREPAPLGFGTAEERREETEGLFRFVPSEETAGAFGIQDTPIGKQEGTSGIDYKAIGEIFADAYGESLDEGLADSESFRQYIIEPRLAKLKEQGVVGKEAQRQAIEEGFAVLQDIQTRIEDKESYLQPETLGSGDPLIRTFSRQVELGEGVPDLTPEQVMFINAREQRRVARAVESKKGEKTTVVVLADGTELPKSVYEQQVKISPELGKPVSEKQVDKSEGQIRLELGEEAKIPWYLDPKKKVEVIANPENFEKVGILTSETPYGTKRETGANWLLRSALIIPNAVAGAGGKLAYDLGPLAEAREEARTKRGYDSAILLNIAENRGFMGEAEEAARLAGIEEGSPLYYTTLAGGFAADILDPSLDIIKAAGVTGKTGVQSYRAMGSLYEGLGTSARASESLKIAGRIGARDFLDNNLIGNLIGKNFDAGDVRGVITRNLADDYTTAMYLQENRLTSGVEDTLTKLDEQGLGNTRLASKVRSEAARLGTDDLNSVMDEIGKFFKDDKILDELGELSFAQGARRKDLARAVGALAASDDELAKSLREFGKEVSEDLRPKIDSFVDFLLDKPRTRLLLRKALSADKAARDVIDATKGIDAFDNLVAITKNTWAGKGSARTILERAKKSKIGQVAQDLADKGELQLVATSDKAVGGPGRKLTPGVTAKLTEPKVQPAYKVKLGDAIPMIRIVQDLRTYGKIPQEIAVPMISRLEKGIITVSDLRQVIDANIDLIAEGLAATEGLTGVTRARDLARLPVGEQIDLLQPLEGRFFTRPWLRKLKEKLTQSKKIEGNLSIGQRQLLRQAETEAAALDQRLIRQLKRALKDPEFRALYGIQEGATRSEILSHLIVGPKESVLKSGAGKIEKIFRNLDIDLEDFQATIRSRKKIIKLLEDSLNDLFFSQQTKENIFDILTGTHVTKNGSVFTPKAYEVMRPLLQDASEVIFDDPSQFFTQLEKIAKAVSVDIVDNGGPALIKFDKEDIVKTLDKDGKIPAEAQIAAFYRSEADRIVENLLSDLVSKEIGKGQLTIDNMFDDDFMQVFRDRTVSLMTEFDPSIARSDVDITKVFSNEVFTDLVRKQTKRILAGEDTSLLEFDDVKDILLSSTTGEVKDKLTKLFDSPDGPLTAPDGDVLRSPRGRQIRGSRGRRLEAVKRRYERAMSPVLEAAEDVARGIIKRNNLRLNDLDIGAVDKIFDDIVSSKNYESDLRLLFGEDVANQLKDQFLSGYDKLRKELLELQAREYEKGVPAAARNALRTTYEYITNFLYTALLNFRPRFHGANLLTGMDIAYSTTGKIVNPVDVLEGAKVVAGKNPESVVFTDPGGRPYTQGELQEILQDVTGRSVYGLNLPQAQSERLINLLEDTKLAKIKEGYQIFKELPQSEDLLFRYAILKSALKEGRSLDEAIALARRSMFDAGNITDLEKQVKNIALFYGFARNNLLNTLQNMASIKGVKRIGKAKRVRDNLSKFFAGEETEEYAPSYASSRVLLGKIGFDPEKGKELIIAGPPLASLDGVYTLAEFIKLEPGGVLGSAVRPEYKSLFGIEDKFDREFKQVPPEHIALLKMAGFNPTDVVNRIVSGLGGEEVIPVPGKTIDGAVDGSIYPLNTPKQRKAYKRFYDTMSLFGISTGTTDLARTFAPEGTKVGEVGTPLAQLAFGVGAMTPMTSFSPERQAYYDRLSRMRDLQSIVKGAKVSEAKRLEEAAPPEEKQKAEEIKEKREKRSEVKKITPSGRKSRMLEIKREIASIKSAVRSGTMSISEAKARMDELKKEVDSLR